MMSPAWQFVFELAFWAAAALLAYTYFGFWLLLAVRAWLWPRPLRLADHTPPLSLLIAAHNEAAVIAAKLENSLGLAYPAGQVEIIVASDGSDDGTPEIAAGYAARGVRLLRLPRQGKNRTLADAAATATGALLVFTDADSLLAPDALRRLAAAFAAPEVGAAAGDYRHATRRAESVGGRSVWDFDRGLKRLQSRAGSLTAVSGALYAVRRELFVPPPAGVTDDFYIAAQVAAAGRRVVFVPEAVATGPAATTPAGEFARTVRVVSAGLRGVWLSRRLLNPLAYGFYAVQLLSHKVLRRLMVLPLLVTLVAALALWPASWFYQAAAAAQLAFHGGAALGYALTRLGRRPPKALRLLLHFDLVNLACLAALAALAAGRRGDVWHTTRLGPDVRLT